MLLVHRWLIASSLLFPLYTFTADAQQITGVPGSPTATTTIDGKQLPPPDPAFGGVIKEKASESKGWWAPRVVPPKGAPNVLLIMTDDGTLARDGQNVPPEDDLRKVRDQQLPTLTNGRTTNVEMRSDDLLASAHGDWNLQRLAEGYASCRAWRDSHQG